MSIFPSREIALTIGQVSVHWYGIMYLLSFLFGIWVIPRLLKYRSLSLTADLRDALVFDVFLGVLFGGRLGFVLFYGGKEYFENPLKILALWEGGMSSHCGFLGVMIALLIFTWRNKIPLLLLGDVLVIPIAVGLALGRFGNLINGELYGTVTALPWGMNFPGAEGLRHPTQIYAVIKDLFVASVCFLLLKNIRIKNTPGMVAAVFLIMYAISRFIVEIFRDQTFARVFRFGKIVLSEGQVLTLPIFIAGMVLLVIVLRNRRVIENATAT